MKIISEVYSEVGKALVNAGVGLNIAALIAWLFTKEAVAWWALPFGIFTGAAQVLTGAWLIQAAHRVKKSEEQTNG